MQQNNTGSGSTDGTGSVGVDRPVAASSNAGREREIARTLETLLLTSIASINHLLGATWSAAQQSQGQGQQAFESKRTSSAADGRQPQQQQQHHLTRQTTE